MNKKEFEEWLDIEVELFNSKIDVDNTKTKQKKATKKD